MAFITYKDLKVVGVEHTTKCNLKCPGCCRFTTDMQLNPNIKIRELTLQDYQRLFPLSLRRQLNEIILCGTNGDIIASSNALECIKFLSTEIHLSIHTNGSLHSVEWWRELAEILNKKSMVVFAIDGTTQETHGKYRVNSELKKVMQNASAFIKAGGNARWDFLVFDYNSHQMDSAKKIAKKMGFRFLNFKHPRFLNSIDIDSNFEKNSYEGNSSEFKELLNKHDSFKKYMKSSTISCKTKKSKEIYIDYELRVWPCCWIGASFCSYSNTNVQKNNILEWFERYGEDFNSLKDKNIYEVLNHRFFKYDLEDYLKNKEIVSCAKNCGEYYQFCVSDMRNRTMIEY